MIVFFFLDWEFWVTFCILVWSVFLYFLGLSWLSYVDFDHHGIKLFLIWSLSAFVDVEYSNSHVNRLVAINSRT